MRIRRFLIIALTIVVAAVCTGRLLRNRIHRIDPSTPAFSHDVYIWQRDWTPQLRDAVADQQSQFHWFVVLAAEISLRSSPACVTLVHPDYGSIAGTVHEIGIAIRLGPMTGSAAYEPGSEQTKLLCNTALDAMTTPRNAGIAVTEVQIDFDCAESKLPGYRNWIRAMKAAIAPTPLVITALPSWLKHPAFADLAREAGGFVIQVHSLHQPAGPDSQMNLFDVAEAEQAVKDAGDCGVPFRVALPTYSYLAGFSAKGKFLGLSAEGPLPNWPEGTVTKLLHSDPAIIAPLVARWMAHPPPHMQGIIWYRLPVTGDSMNWAPVTLKTVMAGHIPQPNLLTELEHPKSGLVDVFIRNTGSADADGRFEISVQSQASVLISEGIGGFERLEQPTGNVIFRDASTNGRRIAPGACIEVGWLRFATDTEVHAYVTAANP